MQQREDEPYHVTLEVVNKGCKGLQMLRNSGAQQFTLSDVRGSPGGLTRHLIRASSAKIKGSADTLTKMSDRGKIKDGESVWFDSDGCDACKAILSQNAFLISGKHVESDTILYSFVASNFETYRNIILTLEAHALKPKILEVTRFNPKGRILTEKQERVLWLALKMGFFEFPRKITMLELSKRLGIGLATVSEIIRRGSRRLFENHFET